VPFDVVPGLVLGAGTAAYAGVPVGSVRTEADLRDVESADYEALAHAAGTLILTVDAADVAYVGEQLVAYGLKPGHPVAVSCSGTTTAQQTVVSQVASSSRRGRDGRLGGRVRRQGRRAAREARLVGVAAAVRLEGARPADEGAGRLDEHPAHRLRRGAVEVPTIAVEPPRTPTQMERAIKGLVTGRYEWIVFTSTNAVRAVREKFEEFGLDARAFAGVKIACVGEATGDAVRAFGIKPSCCRRVSSRPRPARRLPAHDEVLDPIDRVLLRVPTSRPRRWPPGCASSAGRSTT